MVVSALAGCARRVPAPPPIPVATEEAEELLRDVAKAEASVRRYQAVLKVQGKGPEGGFSATLVLIFERPERMRVELLGAFGSTRWVAVVSEGEILVWIPSEREFLRESRVKVVVGALLGLELSPREVMAVLTGTGIPLEGRLPLRAVRQADRVRIELEGAALVLEGGQVRRAIQPHYHVSYPTPWREKGKQVPDRVELESERVEASLRIDDLDVNVALHPQAFSLSLPDDARRLELAQIGGEAVFVKPEP